MATYKAITSNLTYTLSSTDETISFYAGNKDGSGNVTGNADKSSLSYEIQNNNIPIQTVTLTKLDNTAYSIKIASRWSTTSEASAKLYLKNSNGVSDYYITIIKPDTTPSTTYKIRVIDGYHCSIMILGISFGTSLTTELQNMIRQGWNNADTTTQESTKLKTETVDIKYIEYTYDKVAKNNTDLPFMTPDGIIYTGPSGNTLYILGYYQNSWDIYGTITGYTQESKTVTAQKSLSNL